MKRVASLAMVALLVLSAASFAAPASAQDDTILTVDTEVSPDPAPPGTNVTVNATIENVHDEGEQFRVQEVTLRNGSERNSTEYDDVDPDDVVRAGGSTTVSLSEEFDETGSHDRFVHVRLRTNSGEIIHVVREVTVEVEQSHPSMSLAGDDYRPSGRTDLTLTVANGLPDDVRGLTVDLESEDVTLLEDRHVVSSLDPGNEATVTVPVEVAEAGEVELTATLSYLTADGESRTVTQDLSGTVENSNQPAQVDLTGLRVSQDGDDLVLRGSASNLGSTNATGVLVEVEDGDAVSPAESQASYFVGELQASDFSSFEVHADLEQAGNETVTVPLTVSYDVDGDRVSQTVEVEYTPNATTEQPTEARSSGLPLVPVLGVLVVVVLVGGLLWRRYS